MIKGLIKLFFIVLIPTLVVIIIYRSYQVPSLDRDWNNDQILLPSITFSGNIAQIKDIRSFTYNSTTDYITTFYDRDYKIDEIESLYYIIEPFSNFDGPAHTMLSFGFKDGSYLAISVEIRKEVGESFSALKGILNQYELVYMIGDETDLVKLRANYRKDDVIMYPVKTSSEKMQKLFTSMLIRADELTKTPEFYDTLLNNCTTNILKHVNTLRELTNEEKITWSVKTFLPSHSDEVLYKLGLIDTKLSLEDARLYYKINELSEKYADSSDYSKLIRKVRK